MTVGTGFEVQIFGCRSDRSTNCAVALVVFTFFLFCSSKYFSFLSSSSVSLFPVLLPLGFLYKVSTWTCNAATLILLNRQIFALDRIKRFLWQEMNALVGAAFTTTKTDLLIRINVTYVGTTHPLMTSFDTRASARVSFLSCQGFW